MDDIYLVFVTAPSEPVAVSLASTLVNEQVAACCNLIPGVRSIYRWKGELCDEQEWLMVIKCSKAGYPALEKRILELHPYTTPEVIAVPTEGVAEGYRNWVLGEIK
jgi:periplasmic divalent cation tolerance protein